MSDLPKLPRHGTPNGTTNADRGASTETERQIRGIGGFWSEHFHALDPLSSASDGVVGGSARALMEIQVTAERDQLEQQAATILGYMLFEYSRLDMELGLFFVWSEEGQQLEQLTKRLTDENLYARLRFLEKLVQEKYAGKPAVDLYAAWLSDAHAIRSLRNLLFHGRWGFIPSQQLVANVIGLPTSPEQSETRYSIDQLWASLESMRMLRVRLSDLRKKWPV